MPARVGSVMGRYWGMDRDQRWDRTKRAYDALVHAEGLQADSAQAAVKMAYGRDETDEFIQPTIVGEPAPIRDGDSVADVQLPARPDARSSCRALGEPDFAEFDRRGFPRVRLTTMTRYQEDWDYPVAFEEARPETTIAEVLARARRSPAARRRDREVPARDLLLQRRGGAPVSAARTAAWCPRPATSPPTT